MSVRLVIVLLGVALVVMIGARGVVTTIVHPASPVHATATVVPPTKADHSPAGAPLLTKASELVDPSAIGNSMADNALKISLVMLALFGLWGLKRMIA